MTIKTIFLLQIQHTKQGCQELSKAQAKNHTEKIYIFKGVSITKHNFRYDQVQTEKYVSENNQGFLIKQKESPLKYLCKRKKLQKQI